MEKFHAQAEVVDPEIRAYVYSLVSALGGTGTDEQGCYVLGDDALACLKDLKRWLKLYDERTDRLDVARCLAEANLVNGDLLEILASLSDAAMEDRTKSKIALACLELLVPLTWPIEKSDLQMTVNHHRQVPYLRLAQVNYKRGILNHDAIKILRKVVRIGLPSIALPLAERTSRDEGIIKLVVYFLRNIAIISVPPNLKDDGDENEVSRSATIEAFHYQDILHLLLTMSSGMGEDFNTQDVIIMEVLFYLFKGVDIEKLFMNEDEAGLKRSEELQTLLSKEATMLRDYARNAPTRHNRFGTMIWVKRDDNRVSTISGQDALMNDQKTLQKLDKTKKWNKPKPRAKKNESSNASNNDFDLPEPLTPSATKHLRSFVQDFLDSAFNPLFHHIRKAIEREAERLLDIHSRQFFYLIGWFLQANRERRKLAQKAQKDPSIDEADAGGYSIIASVLTQETFIDLNRFMQQSYDKKEWDHLNAGMRCFTQILLTVQEMSESPLEEDQTIAENIQNRIFYEETTHDRIVSIVRYYSNQGFGYLNACTELAHVYLRVLEHYSKQNVEMQVRSRRRARKKKQKVAKPSDAEPEADDEGASEDEDEDIAKAEHTSTERKFDFTRFASKFLTQGCVDTFVDLARYHRDLTPQQLKRAHRFFYRIAFKLDMSVMLFRVDIINLFHKMIKGPEGLHYSGPEYREWEDLVRQVFKKLIRKMAERPPLAVEMLFSKINATAHYLEYGHEKQTSSAKSRATAELEVKPGLSWNEQIGVAVRLLLDQGKSDAVTWVKGVLLSAVSERRAWEGQGEALRSIEQPAEGQDEVNQSRAPSIVIKPDDEARRIAMFKDNKLRLLMTLVGFERLGIEDDANSTWIVPSSASPAKLQEALDEVAKAQSSPPEFDNGRDAEDLVRRKVLAKPRRATFDDDSEDAGFLDDGDEELLFPAGGPTVRKSDALEELKQRRRRRTRDQSTEPLDEEEREERAEARRRAELERRRKIKSELFVHDSDDEEDAERDRLFFEEEENRRGKQGEELLKALQAKGSGNDDSAKSKKRKKADVDQSRKRSRRSSSLSVSDNDDAPEISGASSSLGLHDLIGSTDDEDADTPLSSTHQVSSQEKSLDEPMSALQDPPTPLPATKAIDRHVTMVDAAESSGDDVPTAKVGRGRGRAGFVIDSDSE